MQAKLLLVAVLCLPLTLGAVSCIQSPDDSQSTSTDNDPEPIGQAQLTKADNDPEPIGEAEQKWTKADCYTAWKHNLTQCKTPECWALVSVLLGVCLKGAEK